MPKKSSVPFSRDDFSSLRVIYMLLVKKQFLCESCNETRSYLVLCVFS